MEEVARVPDTDPYTGGLVLQLGVIGVLGGLVLGSSLGVVIGLVLAVDGASLVAGVMLGLLFGAIGGLAAAAVALPFGCLGACLVTRAARRRGQIDTDAYVSRMRVAVGAGGAVLVVASFWVLGLGILLGIVGGAFGAFAGGRVARWVQRQTSALP